MNNANTGVNCVCKSQKSHVTRCRDHKGTKFCNIFFFDKKHYSAFRRAAAPKCFAILAGH